MVWWRGWGWGVFHWGDHFTGMTEIQKEKESLLFSCHRPSRSGYLHGTLHDERGELGHHEVHAFEAGLFQFEDLLFDNRLESQVRGEEPRSGRSWGQIALFFYCGGTERKRERDRQKPRKESKKRTARKERK